MSETEKGEHRKKEYVMKQVKPTKGFQKSESQFSAQCYVCVQKT